MKVHSIFQMIWRNFLRNLVTTSAANDEKQQIAAKPRSVYLRHLDCGSCNGCELELNALSNPVYDIEQYGIRFESSPRHADVIILTGPFTRNLAQAAQRTLTAMPDPRIITVGDCTQDGGLFRDSYAIIRRPAEIEAAVEAHISGCPPMPQEILARLLKMP